jgi:hypothetical protein
MSGFIAKQPNGLYCRFSYVTDCPTHCNLTRDDYINNVTGTVADREEGEDILDHYVRPFSDVIKYFVPINMTAKEFDQLVDAMSK